INITSRTNTGRVNTKLSVWTLPASQVCSRRSFAGASRAPLRRPTSHSATAAASRQPNQGSQASRMARCIEKSQSRRVAEAKSRRQRRVGSAPWEFWYLCVLFKNHSQEINHHKSARHDCGGGQVQRPLQFAPFFLREGWKRTQPQAPEQLSPGPFDQPHETDA